VIVERRNAIAHLVLARPDHGNAIDMALAKALERAAADVGTDPAIRCVVLTGQGRLFCTGGDIAAFAAAGDEAGAFLQDLATTFHRAIRTLATMPKPLLVAVNGPAAGAGLSLAALGDVVVAARSAHFTAAYPALGLTPDGGMTWLLPRLVGLRRAQEMILTNRRVSAEDAVAFGLASQVVDDANLATGVAETARSLADAPTAALGKARALLLDGASSSFDEHLDAEARAIAEAGAAPELKTGLAAFLSRRKPDSRSA
jgi:2-(1,2-epoxy-1,2-dihydrophenyl)acetyl-CoA isomerase